MIIITFDADFTLFGLACPDMVSCHIHDVTYTIKISFILHLEQLVKGT